MTDRTRGIMIHPLDADMLGAAARAHLGIIFPDTEWASARTDMDYATATDPEGKVYVICSEGVGWEIDWHKPFVLDVITSWKGEDGKVVSGMTASTPVPLHLKEVERAAKEETIDLADFVRAFGSRLESNFYQWQRTLSPKPVKRTRKAKA